MKRSYQPGSKQELFEQSLALLEVADRDQRISIIQRAQELYNEECSYIVQSIPNEIWRTVFLYCNEIKEDTLFCLACVCTGWTTIIDELVRYLFADNVKSDRVISRFTELTTLTLFGNRLVTNQSLSKLTNLHTLDLSYTEKVTGEV